MNSRENPGSQSRLEIVWTIAENHLVCGLTSARAGAGLVVLVRQAGSHGYLVGGQTDGIQVGLDRLLLWKIRSSIYILPNYINSKTFLASSVSS